MLDSKAAFKEAIRHFPKWMDIRKRKNVSDGGKYLQSIVNELDDIQKSIEDYKKDFFIVNYIGKEDTVIDYLYVAEVGDVEIDNFILLSPLEKVTADTKLFYSSDEPMALYQDGRLLFKTDYISEIDTIKYSRNGFAYTAKLRKVHIWNVIDEFALYAGISRQENEKNKSLLNRTLLVFKQRANSTEAGLKHAIVNIVSGYDEVKPDEIKIDQPSSDNLFKEDDDFDTIIERLAHLNKDTYRTKQWDESRWEHDFKTIEHISPAWDEEPEEIQDGVGHNDALKASLLSEIEDSESTDVRIDLYKKSDVRINEYVRNQRVEVDVDLQLKKYKNVLKPKQVEYKITAAETIDLTNSNVYIDCHRTSEGENRHYISDLILNANDVKDITIQRGKLKSNTKYKLQFLPREEYSEMELIKASISNEKTSQSLLKEKGAYKLNSEGVLRNSNVRLHAKSTRNFSNYSNIRDLKDGFTLSDATKDGTIELNVTGMNNQYVKLGVEAKETSIIRNRELVDVGENYIMNEANQLVSTSNEGDIVIDLTCNQLYYEMESGNCIITKVIDGEHFPSEIWYEANSEHLKFDQAKHVQVIIRKLNNEKELIINDIRYAEYAIEMDLLNGQLIHTPLGTVLPSTSHYEQNYLTLTIKAFSGFAPEIKFIHVGPSLKNAMYETDVFTTGDVAYLDFDTNCEVKLVELNNDETIASIKDDFVCKDLYKNTRNAPVYLQIDSSGFASIRRTIPAIDRFSYQGVMSNWIRLDVNEEIDTILIDGTVQRLISRVYINNLLQESPLDKVYATRKLKGFIVQNGSKEKLVQLPRSSIDPSADVYTVHNLPYGSRGVFVINSESNVELIGSSYNQPFQSFYIFPGNMQEYIAYNQVNMLRPEATDVEIVDLFSPIIPTNKLMVYVIEPITKEGLSAKAEFIKDKSFELWSLGKKKIRVEVEIDQDLSENYALEQLAIKQKFVLSNNINLEEQFDVNGESVNIGEYIVSPPEGMRVIHENRASQPEVLFVEDDGFNKLKYSNIASITSIKRSNGTTIPASNYQLLKPEGIIAWKNENLFGEEVTIEYRYGVPKYVTFIDLEKLYELVGYNVEAYRFQSSLSYRNVGEDIVVNGADAQELTESDRVIASSSNPNFRVRIDNDVIRLTKISEEDFIAVRSGFFYQDGQELYHFANRNEDLLERLGNVELINTERLAGLLKLNHQSKNFLPGSSMKPERDGLVSIADFANNDRISGLSRFDALTACDNYNNWNAFEMDISFVQGLNGLGMQFEQTNKDGYAMIDITKYLSKDTILSLYSKDQPEVMIAQERLHQNHSFNKSIFATPLSELNREGKFRYFVFNKDNYREDVKYYLVVKSNGIVDDIVIKDYTEDESIPSIHLKEIDSIGFNVEERTTADYIQRFLFNKDGNQLNQAEIASDGTIKTGVNIDWGFTKTKEFKNNWLGCTLKEVDLVKDLFIQSGSRSGSIETEAVYVRNRESMRSLIVKINELLLDNTTGFGIEVYTSDRSGGMYNLVASEKEGNTLIVPQGRLSNYIKVKVDMPPNKTINNLEIFSEYIETESPLRISEYDGGQLVTGIYDSGFEKHYLVKQLNVDQVSNLDLINFSVRAFRQEDNRLVWTDWKPLEISNSFEVLNPVEFEDYRYFQFSIELKSRLASININSIDLEVIG